MIASGVCDADAYYRGPYEGGAAFLLIKDERFPRSKNIRWHGLLTFSHRQFRHCRFPIIVWL